MSVESQAAANLSKRKEVENGASFCPDSKRSKPDEPSTAADKQQKELERKLEKEAKEAEKRALKEKKEAERKAEKDRKELERKAEKERKEAERKAEKERKEAERLSEKARKEAEKEAERAKKEAEKEAERLRKEAEKQAEKERKEAEKRALKEKKEKEHLKAQPKINLFFKSTPTTNTAPSTMPASTATAMQVDSAASLIGNSDGPNSVSIPPSEVSEPQSDYRKSILPFHVKQNGTLFSGICNYSHTALESDLDPLEWLQQQNKLDRIAKAETKSANPPKITSQQFRAQLALAQESSQVVDLLGRLRIRRLQFSHLSPKYIEDPAAPVNEEFRPPYVGSVKDVDSTVKDVLALDPFRVDLVDHMAYEYDSEAEWENEDGEDLREDDGDDSDEDMDDPEDLREFLSSDEDDAGTSKRPKLIGPLTPVVIWGNNGEDLPELQPFAIELLSGPIEPLKPKDPPAAVTSTDSGPTADSQTSEATFAFTIAPLEQKVGFAALKESLASHNGSTGTKTLIVELLKQQFPVATAQEVRTLFDRSMIRVGKKRTEKRWIVSSEASEHFGFERPAETNYVEEPMKRLAIGMDSSPAKMNT